MKIKEIKVIAWPDAERFAEDWAWSGETDFETALEQWTEEDDEIFYDINSLVDFAKENEYEASAYAIQAFADGIDDIWDALEYAKKEHMKASIREDCDRVAELVALEYLKDAGRTEVDWEDLRNRLAGNTENTEEIRAIALGAEGRDEE